MAHPTALWRVLWRFFVFCLLVGRILADARETFAAARCAQDELMQPCVDAALGEATKGALRDRWFFLVAFLEILFNLRTGSVDSKGHFDMRPWAAFKRYVKWQFWFDLVLLPPWWLDAVWKSRHRAGAVVGNLMSTQVGRAILLYE